MSKKLKKEELKNVSGGDSFVYTVVCKNELCKKRFTPNPDAIKNGKVYCPYCGAFYSDAGKIDW